jgi:hypothetical protein
MHPHFFFPVSARFSFQSTCTVFPLDWPRLLSVPLSPAGPFVAAARKQEIKSSGGRQLTYLWSGSRVNCCWFSSVQPKPNQTQPVYDEFSLGLISTSYHSSYRNDRTSLVYFCVYLRKCLCASFRSFMHVWCWGLTGDQAGFHWRQ